MDGKLLETLFGDKAWSAACVVLVDSPGVIRAPAPERSATGGLVESNKLVSGRILADAVCYLKDRNAMLTLEQATVRDGTGRERLVQTLSVIDGSHVVAVEFASAGVLKGLGVPMPFIPEDAAYRPGTLVG